MSSAPLPSLPRTTAAAPDLGAVRAAAQRCGIALHHDAYGTQSAIASAAPAAGATPLADGALAWLPGQSVLQVDGDDAARFLQSQTTNDVLQQAPDAARWQGYCSPKGRLLATMLAWRDAASIRLLLPDSVAETIRRRLTMFVLRAKVRITNESGTLVVLGVSGAAGADALARLQLAPPAPMQVAFAGAADATDSRQPQAHRLAALGLPPLPAAAREGASADVPRWLLVVPVAAIEGAWQALRARLEPVDSRAWRWTDVRSGVASVVAATSEQFVPQMLNLEADAIAAVSFTKGCYPGQEIVARSHYLGKTKRRAFLGRIAPATAGAAGPSSPASASGADSREPQPGADVVDAAGQAVGVVVSAAPSPDGAIDVLYEAQVAAANAGALAVDGQALLPLALPYSLPAE
ncbi:MAG: folate-binding protein [Burkholderiaceae bacterium]|nr:folate-binding protein [Burkholderiaceae bacterium]